MLRDAARQFLSADPDAPILIDHGTPVVIEGEGGPLTFEPLPQIHGDIISLGFRIGGLAYCPDVSDFPAPTAARLHGLDVLVIDALQYRTHPSHFSLGQALDWIDKAQAAEGRPDPHACAARLRDSGRGNA